jgi:hypothetical protein
MGHSWVGPSVPMVSIFSSPRRPDRLDSTSGVFDGYNGILWCWSTRSLKLTTHLQLVHKSRNMYLYSHSPIRIYSLRLSQISTGGNFTILSTPQLSLLPSMFLFHDKGSTLATMYEQLDFELNESNQSANSIKLLNYWKFVLVFFIKHTASWDVTQCGSCKNRRFGEIYRLHHQGKRISELYTTFPVNSDWGTHPTNANVVPSSLILFTLMMEAISSSKTSVLTRIMRHNIPEDGILHSHRRENIKSYIALTGWDL